jgi:hypothetical protein
MLYPTRTMQSAQARQSAGRYALLPAGSLLPLATARALWPGVVAPESGYRNRLDLDVCRSARTVGAILQTLGRSRRDWPSVAHRNASEVGIRVGGPTCTISYYRSLAPDPMTVRTRVPRKPVGSLDQRTLEGDTPLFQVDVGASGERAARLGALRLQLRGERKPLGPDRLTRPGR